MGLVWVKCGRFKKVQKVPKFRGIFGKCGMCGIDFQERKKINGISDRFSRDVTGNHFPRFRPNRRYCLQQSRNFSHGGLLRRSDSDHPAGMRAEKAELRCILERLSNQPVQPSAPAGAGHPTRRQTAGKEAAPGRYPHRTGDFIRHCIKIHRLQVRACNRCFCVPEDVLQSGVGTCKAFV